MFVPPPRRPPLDAAARVENLGKSEDSSRREPPKENPDAAPIRNPGGIHFASIKEEAERGNAETQFRLAEMYYASQDYTEAEKWYSRAAGQGHTLAQFCLGGMNMLGTACCPSVYEGRNWFRKALQQPKALARLDDLESRAIGEVQFCLAAQYDAGLMGNAREPIEAAKWYRKAAERGHKDALLRLSDLLLLGDGIAQNNAEAVKWLHKAGEQGVPEAQIRVFRLAEQGVPEAQSRLFQLAGLGIPEAQTRLGEMYFAGKGVPQDFSMAANLYRKAADHGSPEALFRLAEMYYAGKGVPQDFSMAANLYRKAADHGSPDARFRLAEMYYAGKGVPQDFSMAANLYREAAEFGSTKALSQLARLAEQGNAEMQMQLAEMHCSGKGSAQDSSMAVRLFCMAAEQGVQEAQTRIIRLAEQGIPEARFWLAEMYYTGKGLPQDFSMAASLFRKGADQGHAKSQLRLGLMLYNGVGVPCKDFTMGLKWLREALSKEAAFSKAEFGQASFTLGRILDEATGSQRDLVEAAYRYEKAAELGIVAAHAPLADFFEDFRDRMEGRLRVHREIITIGVLRRTVKPSTVTAA